MRIRCLSKFTKGSWLYHWVLTGFSVGSIKNTFMTTSNSPHPVSLISYGGFISTADKYNIIYHKFWLVSCLYASSLRPFPVFPRKTVSCLRSYKVMSCNKTHGALLVHGVWLHWRARVRVYVWCSCVRNTGKEVLHRALTISIER